MYRKAIFKICSESDITGYQMNYPARTEARTKYHWILVALWIFWFSTWYK